MATLISYTEGQRRTQARLIGEIFGVDPNMISVDFEMQSWGEKVMITVHVVKHVDKATANAILNPVETPEEPA